LIIGTWYFLIYLSMYLDQETGRQRSDVFCFESSSHLLLLVKLLKGRGNSVKCLAQGHDKWTC